MPSPILPTTVAIPRISAPAANLSLSVSSVRFLSGAHQFPLLHADGGRSSSSRELVIRMGGGPRTYPGGVSKWQWKRMQAKKAKQLLKARLCRERQLYEMRKRAELRAAAAELERPWEVIERAPRLFSVGADEQLRALADRFQRPGGFDMWNDGDGPQVFRPPPDGLPTARFFPKGVVHSVKPYGVDRGLGEGSAEELRHDDWIARGAGGIRRRRSRRSSDGGGDGRGPEEAVDVEAKTLDEGTDQNSTFTAKNSRSARNLNKQDGSSREKSRVSSPASDGRGNRSNLQKGRFSWNEFDETVDYLKELKVEDAGVKPRNHGNGTNQGFVAPFSKVENGKVGRRRRNNTTSNGRSKMDLRPTTQLFHRKDRNAMGEH